MHPPDCFSAPDGAAAGSKPSKDKMRSSKSRSRSKQNRPRTLGNIINRVFDSSGPEGKVRGTPQQIIEKYLALARDAQLSNDRVAAENFLQHAEHYTRMLAEAQREQAAEQEARQQFHQQNQNRDRQGGERGERQDYRGEQPDEFAANAEGFDVVGGDDDGHLVELPEAPRPQQHQNQRRDDNRRRDDNNQQNRRRDDNRRDDQRRDDNRRDDGRRDDQRREDNRRREDRPQEPRAEVQRVEIAVKVEEPAAPVVEAPAVAEVTEAPAKAPRAPRKPRAPKAAPEGGNTPEAAE